METIPIRYPEPNDSNSDRHLLLVRLRSDTGHVGWGEAVTMWPEATQATAALVSGLAPLITGRDVAERAELWNDLQDHTWWYGRGGIAAFALAGLDIALWDLDGQRQGCNVVDLVGGAVHDELPIVVSCHAMLADLDEMAAAMARWVSEHQASGIKVGFGKRGGADLGRDRTRDREFVRKLRDALPDEADIMIDIGSSIHWDAETAIGRARDWAPHRISWIEEPLGADDPVGYRRLKDATDIPIAYGEREWTPRGVERIVQSGTVDIVGVDPGRLEGITGFQRANATVASHGCQVNAHAWSSAIVTAASLATSLAAANCRQIEIKPLPNPMQDELVRKPVVPHRGYLRALSGPGLGIDVDTDVVERYRMRS